MNPIEKIFRPKSIAVIGASPTEGKIGYSVLRNILYLRQDNNDRSLGYQGKVYPVNVKYDEILGLKVHRSVLDIDGELDLAVVIVPGKFVPAVIDECGQKGCKNAIIISAGFSEYGDAGKQLEKELDEAARKHSVRFIGPNCLGIISTYLSLNASFAQSSPQQGPLSMISQSGALCTAIIAYAQQEHIGFSNFASSGNKSDVEDTDLIAYFDSDDKTKCIAIYMESIGDGRKFFETAREVSKKTPIVIMKVGRTAAGQKAASSHTGALAGTDTAYDAAFKQAGVYRCKSMFDMFDSARALSYQPVPKGENVVILTNAGGPGVISSDAAFEIGLKTAELSAQTISKLDEICPPSWSHSNPADILGDADVERYMKALNVLVKAPEIDGIIILVAPVGVVDSLELAKRIAKLSKETDKPMIASFVGMIGDAAEDYLESAGVPTIEFPEGAVVAMDALVRRMRYLKKMVEMRDECKVENLTFPKSMTCSGIIEKARVQNRTTLTLDEARRIFSSFGIPLTKSEIAKSPEEAAQVSASIGYPVAMKISSSDVLHKTDVGGVVLDVRNEAEAIAAYARIVTNVRTNLPSANIEGVVIDEMAKGPELIIGVSYDSQFGPMIMFGLGGILVEINRDVSFRLAPITICDAREMIQEIKGKAAFMGARGMPAADLEELAALLVKVSNAVLAHPEIAEIDINPLVVTKSGMKAIDARILLRK